MSIQIIGGGADQQALIRAAHGQAISAATAAQTAAQGGAAPFSTWFGAASTSAVAAGLGAIVTALSNDAWTYDLSKFIDSIVSPDVYVSPKTITAQNAVTAVVWNGLFLQSNTSVGQRLAALSLIHVAAELNGSTTPSFIEDDATAQAYAALEPVAVVSCARNYVGFAGAVSPA